MECVVADLLAGRLRQAVRLGPLVMILMVPAASVGMGAPDTASVVVPVSEPLTPVMCLYLPGVISVPIVYTSP